ncbi:hypothetical protein AOQ84DRAFT_433713 [Glonium stellatum]|uniref:6-methylsalicylate decarboxylase n=1 Tax=Glonium stellatum TaxID=574774 RepID=A0A8E2JNP1_9PEZI|nr:hypothetical protein AOQ84DRAFT_433713 [Glonium stellatum]
MSKIDVHHHVYPPEFTEALNQAGGDPSGWYIPPWTLSADHDIKTLTGTKTAILSVTAPGPSILAYALDTLHADGVIVYTRYGTSHTYLGDAALAPVWAELDRRAAVVFVHPTHPVNTALVNAHMAQPLFDYPHETGRAAIDLILQGRTRQFPHIKFMLSHAGGTLPALVDRVAGLLPHTPMSVVGLGAEEILAEARRFYFDTALSSAGTTMGMLLGFAEKGHVLFGSDFPNAPDRSIKYFTRQLEGLEVGEEVKEDIYFWAARKLFPRLAGREV